MDNHKLEALLTVAYDFYARKDKIQYDQKSMDRFVQLTPRRRKFLPPEAATDQYTLYLDCSGFCFDVYYQAFGYELPSDLTWHIIELGEPRIYCYERQTEETPEEKEKIIADIKACLKPGDLITLRHQGKSGHIMLYIGNGQYMNCRPEFKEIDDSYDYVKCENHHRDAGGIYIDNLEYLFYPKEDESFERYYMFSPKETCFSICRPLDIVGEPTSETVIRMEEYKGLWTAVECSHAGGLCAVDGDTIKYDVIVRNLTDQARKATINFKAPKGSRLVDESIVSIELTGKEERRVSFSVIAVKDQSSEYWIDPPHITVNGLTIHGQRVLLGKSVEDGKVKQLICDVKKEIAETADAAAAASRAYEKQGISMNPEKSSYLFSHFYLHDTTVQDVLSRRPQNPYQDMAVYSYFGGTGVVTPEMGSSTGIRTTQIKASDLMAGDIILCSDDTFGRKSYSSLFTGESLIGSFEAGEDVRTIKGEEMERFIDSLFGRFCFIVLRPYLAG